MTVGERLVATQPCPTGPCAPDEANAWIPEPTHLKEWRASHRAAAGWVGRRWVVTGVVLGTTHGRDPLRQLRRHPSPRQ